MDSIQSILKDLRVRRHYSRSFIAKNLDVSLKAYKDIEAGLTIPIPLEFLYTIRVFYDYPLELMLDLGTLKNNKFPLVPVKEYYIQNGCIGNAVLWLVKDSSAYTTEIDQAGRYTKKQAQEIIICNEDSAWLCEHVDTNVNAAKLIIDYQYLDAKYNFRDSILP